LQQLLTVEFVFDLDIDMALGKADRHLFVTINPPPTLSKSTAFS
jgi:hypothetical protein